MNNVTSIYHQMFRTQSGAEKIKVGISGCLLGQEVRFDGGHKHDRFCTRVLAEYFEFVPICPEMAIGMGAPRDPVRLVSRGGELRMVGTRDPDRDFTAPMRQWSEQRARHLEGLSGYIFMQKSPSCGVFRVKVYNPNGHPEGAGSGLWAEAVQRHNPCLPVEESGRLNDAMLLENFLTRVFTYHEWQQLMSRGLTARALVDFHRRHKLLLMAHDPGTLSELGRVVAGVTNETAATVGQAYIHRMMDGMKRPATRRRHTHVLHYLRRFMKAFIPRTALDELATLTTQYAQGQVPLIVPVTFLKHYLTLLPDEAYLRDQVYFQPHPSNLGLRNAI